MTKLSIILDAPIPGVSATLQDMLTNRELTTQYQQVVYEKPQDVYEAMNSLRKGRPLTSLNEINSLKKELAEVAKGNAVVLQAGLCVEVINQGNAQEMKQEVAEFADMMHDLENQMNAKTGKKTVLIGRIAGQLTKPRSKAYEVINGTEVPTYRGEMIHSLTNRKPDPERLITTYKFSNEKSQTLAAENAKLKGAAIHASHEALSLPYEYGMMQEVDGKVYAGSAPYIWIGDRTRQVDGPHITLAALVENPVGIKINAQTTPQDLDVLINAINPQKEPGKLTLVFRMGLDNVEHALPPLLDVVAKYKDSVIAMCDPMHGNTKEDMVTQKKTRYVEEVTQEAVHFATLCKAKGIHPGGIHIEASAEEVTECLGVNVHYLGENYKTLCDPCLNPTQAASVTRAFGEACAKKQVLI